MEPQLPLSPRPVPKRVARVFFLSFSSCSPGLLTTGLSRRPGERLRHTAAEGRSLREAVLDLPAVQPFHRVVEAFG